MYISVSLDVRKVSGDLVMRWKRLVTTPPQPPPEEVKKVGSAKRKTPHPSASGTSHRAEDGSKPKAKKGNPNAFSNAEKRVEAEESKHEEVFGDKVESSKKTPSSDVEKPNASSAKTEKPKAIPVKAGDSKSEKDGKGSELSKQPASNKLNEFNMFEKLGEERKEKKRRPKTAKTYTSKFRSTGSVLLFSFLPLSHRLLFHFFYLEFLHDSVLRVNFHTSFREK